MQTRRAFLSTGRIIGYVVALLVIGGFYFVFTNYIKSEETVDDGMSPPPASTLSKYLADQHRSASVNPQSLQLTDPAKMSDTFAQWLGQRHTIEDLLGEKPTLKFVGARTSSCPIPQAGPSVQLLFSTNPAGGAGSSASLFLKKYLLHGDNDLAQGTVLSLPQTGGSLDTTLIWRKGGLLYILVGPKEPMEALKAGMKCPPAGAEYRW